MDLAVASYKNRRKSPYEAQCLSFATASKKQEPRRR
jgi:hypothetical protein